MSAPKDPQKRENLNSGRFPKGSTPWNKGKQTGQSPANKGIPMSDEVKAKVSASRKGIPRSPEDAARAAESNRGKKRTPEQRARMSDAMKGRKYSPETRAKMSAAKRGKPSSTKGIPLSEERRLQMSLARKGKPNSKLKGYKHSDEFRVKRSESNTKRWQNITEDERRTHLDKLHKGAQNITKSSIEEAYAERLDAQGIVYERQKRIGWYRVDFYIPNDNRVVEINGCYWHCCEQCGYVTAHEGKREKDTMRYDYLRRKGYIVDIIWEHELRRKSSGGGDIDGSG